MELMRSETTGCLRANINGTAPEPPAHRLCSLLLLQDWPLPACSSIFAVAANHQTSLES